jgi:hypothetical protein
MQTPVPTSTTVVHMQLTWAFYVIIPILILIIVYVLHQRRVVGAGREGQIEEIWLDNCSKIDDVAPPSMTL